MIGILTAVICLGATCQSVYIPTPSTFECSQRYPALKYIEENYPEWSVKLYRCEKGRIA